MGPSIDSEPLKQNKLKPKTNQQFNSHIITVVESKKKINSKETMSVSCMIDSSRLFPVGPGTKAIALHAANPVGFDPPVLHMAP